MKLDTEPIDYDNCIAPQLGKTSKILDHHLHTQLISDGLFLSKEQMIVLKKLYIQDGLNQNELACLVFRNKSSLGRLLIKMEKKGYIYRKQSKNDKRINQVFLSMLGKEIFEKTRPVIKKIMTQVEESITAEEKDRIIEILQKIQANIISL